MTDRAAPYPADTKAKGWRFELDHERIEGSATWALAPAEARPWLLMLWMTAWRQVPCGSLDADEQIIAARIGAPPKLWAKHRAVLMRGWWRAEDGRLYHDTIAELVVEMMARRRSESDRKATQRAKRRKDSDDSPAPVPRDTRGKPAESDTDHRPPNTDKDKSEHQHPREAAPPKFVPAVDNSPPSNGTARAALVEVEGHEPTPAGLACRAIRAGGIPAVNPGHPDLLRLIEAGVTADDFRETAAELVGKGKGSFPLLLATIEGRRRDAAAKGAVPAEPVAPWHDSRAGIEAKGAELGIGRWDQAAAEVGRGDQWPTYRRRVFAAAGHEEAMA